MRFKHLTLMLAAAGSIVAASPSPHRHHHHHLAEKRSPDKVKVITVNAYSVGGKLVSLKEVCAGFKAGTLKLADGGSSISECNGHQDGAGEASIPEIVSVTSAVSASTASSSAPSSSTQSVDVPTESSLSPSASSPPAATSASLSPTSDVSTAPVASSSSSPQHYSDDTGSLSNGNGLDREFPSGEIDCSDFPSDYGPIEIPWMALGGWSGIQYTTIENNAVTNIDTAVPGGRNCSANAMCSYACPPGYQKSQWPSAQGTVGQSVGGLFCNQNNKLELTNKQLSKTLCIQGTGATKVQNKLSSNACICRTDYPGTESETVPLITQPGVTSELTCPDSKTYFTHNGDPTTAQYYVNNKGVPKEKACSWNKDGSHEGNWAPVYFGVGRDIYEKTWLSISSTKQNNPTDYQPLDYDVEIVGDNLSGKCKYCNGQYCSGNNYENCNTEGCTVELMSGDATYVLTDSQ